MPPEPAIGRRGYPDEVWVSLIERQAIRRGTFRSVRDLNAKIRAFTDGWHSRAHPFVWTKTADQILKNRKELASLCPHDRSWNA
ncbi:hypothetical protein J7I98_39475 [Streptomyces sp. ISL-98]|uniref:hypothetical protein n=1 Tax=Streptomyces sp. ISL-98 TaxID=2819192 RepID=UPI001BEC21CF|nr:hypothetical protein [Streptomyces sp. ISL-98]